MFSIESVLHLDRGNMTLERGRDREERMEGDKKGGRGETGKGGGGGQDGGLGSGRTAVLRPPRTFPASRTTSPGPGRWPFPKS